jgi:drug/metabolite transporter (DMT)-like permease
VPIAPVGEPALIGMVLGTALLGVVSTYLMNIMLAADNPGKVICVVSGTNNIVVYLLGSLFYGRLSGTGLLGAALIGAGIVLITRAKQVPVD